MIQKVTVKELLYLFSNVLFDGHDKDHRLDADIMSLLT